MKTLFNLTLFTGILTSTFAQKVIREKIFSAKMKKEISTIIVTPDIKPHQQYKTVYILHGYSGNPERT
jgi:hypothetical protein